MKIYKTKIVTREENILAITQCNKCGKEVDMMDEENYVEQSLLHEFKVNFGYGSKHDSETWKFDVCDDCMIEFIQTFKIEPDKID